MQGIYHLHYHRTLGSCNPVEAFAIGSDGALAEWLQPYNCLSDCSLMDISQRLGLQRSARLQPSLKQARKQVTLPRADDTDSTSQTFAVFDSSHEVMPVRNHVD